MLCVLCGIREVGRGGEGGLGRGFFVYYYGLGEGEGLLGWKGRGMEVYGD